MKIIGRIYGIVGVLGLSTIAIAGISIYGQRQIANIDDAVDRTSQRAFLNEKINGLITAVVMDARGTYFAKSTQDAKQFSDGILKSLSALQDVVQQAGALVPLDEAKSFQKMAAEVGDFVKFRSETARLAVEASPAAANEQGNTDANRANRKALQGAIDEQTAAIRAKLDPLRAESDAVQGRVEMLVAGTTAAGLLVGAGIAVFMGMRTLSRPVRRVSETLTEIAGGNLDVAVDDAKSGKDEIGDLWASAGRLLSKLQDAEHMRQDQAASARRHEAEKHEAMRDLADRLDDEVSSVVRTVAAAVMQLEHSASSMNSSAGETSRQSTVVAAAAEQATSNVQTAASAAEQLSASVREIGGQVSSAAQIAAEATDQARGTVEVVRGLSASAQRIGQVVSLITDIAAQTNLLALNATIEAARAGEAGRGFAVVATEVKTLAEQTSRATDEISSQITAVQEATGEVVRAIDGISGTIRRIDEISSAIAAAIEQQGAATGEIAQNVQQAAQGTQDVSSSITLVSTAAADTGRVSGEITRSATDLSAQASRLRLQVDAFIERVRAA